MGGGWEGRGGGGERRSRNSKKRWVFELTPEALDAFSLPDTLRKIIPKFWNSVLEISSCSDLLFLFSFSVSAGVCGRVLTSKESTTSEKANTVC